MKRILLLTDEMSQGGAERQLAAIAVLLKESGYEVRLVKFYDGENFYASDMDRCGLTAESVTEGRSPLRRPFVIFKLVKEWNPDLVVTYKDGSGMAACIARMMCKFNLAVSERNTTQQISKKERFKFFLYRFADYIVPNSYSQKDFIEKNFRSLKDKIRVITNVVDSDVFSPGDAKRDGNECVVVTTARIAPQKNVLNYLDAVSLLKSKGVNVKFVWYGRAEYSGYFEKIRQRINELGIEDMVSFPGETHNVQDKYREADIFCLPSLFEGFPNVLCEAMSSGLTCIATKVSDNAAILNREDRLCDPKNPRSIADALLRAISMNVEKRRCEGMENRKRIKELCSPESFLNKYEALIKQALKV